MPVFGSGGSITHTEGSRVVWSATRAPAKLLDAEIVVSNFDVAFPDLSKNNAYGFNRATAGIVREACTSWATIVPQSWDSGLSLVTTIPAACNYFEVQLNLTRIVEPSTYLGAAIPKTIPEGQWMTLNGRGAVIERFGPVARIFRFERVGNSIYLRRKQSVTNAGQRVPWESGNNVTVPGFTHGGNANGWIAAQLENKILASSSNNRRRGDPGECSLIDITNYASTWRGTLRINAGYLNI